MESVTHSPRTFSTATGQGRQHLSRLPNPVPPSLADQKAEALTALQAAGFPFVALPETNTGKFQRDRKQDKYWCIASTYTTRDGRECLAVSAGDASVAGNVEQATFTWNYHKDAVGAPDLPAGEQAYMRQQQQAAQLQLQQAREQEQQTAADRAQALLASACPLGDTVFGYLADKGLHAPALPFLDGQLLIPYQDIGGSIRTVQWYDALGNRKNLAGGSYSGCFHVLGDWPGVDTVLLCESLTTALTLHQCTGLPVLNCLAAGNLVRVATAVHTRHPGKRLLVCGDDDRWKGRNTGAEAAQQAAEAVQADYVLPDFTGLDQSGQPTDFDDLRQLAGDDAVKKQIGEVLHREPETAVRCIGIDDFLVKSYPPRVNLLAPWLQNPGLAMIYAWRGVGKTHVAMRVAYAVASGGRYLDWVAPQPQPVLYLDGEMPAVVMQERLRQLVTSSDREPPPGFFNLITLDEQGAKGMPNLSTLDGQRALEPYTQKAKLIIVDNISTLARSGEENSSDDWLAMQQWCLRMRSEGRTVLLIHHAGKGGAQRGTSRREDVLDTVISLKRPSDYEEAQGARFEIHFEKARGIFGDDVKPIEAQLESLPDGGERWSVMALEASTYDRVVDLTGLGMSQTEIARELGINRSNVSRNIRKARECGDLSHKNNAKEA